MKSVHRSAWILCALLLSSLAFAKKDEHSGKFDLLQPAQIGSTQLPPGHYKVEWQPEQGNSVKLEVMREGKTVVTTEAKLKNLAQPSPYNAVTTEPTSQDHNRLKIEEIDFSNRKVALVLGS